MGSFFIFYFMDELKELFVSFHKIFKEKVYLQNALHQHLFDDDYVKMFVLVMDYYNLLNVPPFIIKMSLDARITSEPDWNELVEFASNLWEQKAKKEINKLTKT